MSDINGEKSCHKKCFIPKHPLLFPVQVGAKKAAKRFDGMYHDDEGENISEKNPMYCELTAQYWAWKNDPEADYYGFFHYRRYMSFSEKTLKTNLFEDAELDRLDDSSLDELNLKPEVMEKLIEQYDVIGTTPVNLKRLHRDLDSNYTQYAITPYQYAEDLDVMLDIIKEKYPEYYDVAEYYLKKSHIGYFCNMFIMKKELFNKYCEWLFTILEEHERRRDYTNYDVAGYRVSGYLAERLFGIYYTYLKQKTDIKYIDLQRTMFKDTDPIEEIKPAFPENNIPIAIAFDDGYAPYAAVTLQSIIDNSSDNNNYDILCLCSRVTQRYKTRLLNIVKHHSNISMRFVDPKYIIGKYKLQTLGHFSVETYNRLVLPEMLNNYDKIVYIDTDMVLKKDIAELYKIDVKGYMLGACYDADTSGLYNGYQRDKKKYMDEVLKLEDPYSYFQAGTLIMNLEEFRKTYTVKEILDFAVSEKWQLLDQDILNVLCKNRVKYIDMRWNVMVDYADVRIKEIIKLAPQWQNKMYMEARKDPYIIHYAGPDKPWYRPSIDFGDDFWYYARKTSFYEEILNKMMMSVQFWKKRRKPKTIIGGGIQCVLDHGLMYTISYIPERLSMKK